MLIITIRNIVISSFWNEKAVVLFIARVRADPGPTRGRARARGDWPWPSGSGSGPAKISWPWPGPALGQCSRGWWRCGGLLSSTVVVVVVRIQLACDEFSHSVNLDLEIFKILQTFFLWKFTPIKVIIYSSHLSL